MMNQDATGTFKLKMPADLLAALQQTPIDNPAKNMEVSAMRPSLLERVLALFSRH